MYILSSYFPDFISHILIQGFYNSNTLYFIRSEVIKLFFMTYDPVSLIFYSASSFYVCQYILKDFLERTHHRVSALSKAETGSNMILSLSSLIHLVSREKPDVAADYAVLLLTIVSAALHIVVGDGAGCLLHARRELTDAETYAHSEAHGSIFIPAVGGEVGALEC